MGKNKKEMKQKVKHPRNHRENFINAAKYWEDEHDDSSYQVTQPRLSPSDEEDKESKEEREEADGVDDVSNGEEEARDDETLWDGMPSKFLLYQESVQKPKGDISYMQKFFLMYVGGRKPLYLQEDFCGTALLSTEWIRSDSRRTAVGLDLDLEALDWCMENNIPKVGGDGFSRLSLFHGNVLRPLQSKLVKSNPLELIKNITLEENRENLQTGDLESNSQAGSVAQDDKCIKRDFPARDIVCAFNYSCCCLHKRADLVLYFKHAHSVLSPEGGIFVMDLYGGTSSEGMLKITRTFPNFTYEWEQADFDVIERKTRISLHFQLKKKQGKLSRAFSYSWRLWTLPEIRDCLEEAGFKSVHFWLRKMPDLTKSTRIEGFGVGKDDKYEEVTSFEQQNAWNAYIVGVNY
ncbi:methyltransferase type 11 [Senna tora]|uniref:Methyltransferase type 11 n=1 Tax=Senna tora TaxID=362788 RepID=A0A834WND1_9FABA|nr:methyltransferase type 11 [Senna tora]